MILLHTLTTPDHKPNTRSPCSTATLWKVTGNRRNKNQPIMRKEQDVNNSVNSVQGSCGEKNKMQLKNKFITKIEL